MVLGNMIGIKLAWALLVFLNSGRVSSEVFLRLHFKVVHICRENPTCIEICHYLCHLNTVLCLCCPLNWRYHVQQVMIRDPLIKQELLKCRIRIVYSTAWLCSGINVPWNHAHVHVCVPKIKKEICIVLIPSYTNSRVMSENPEVWNRCLPSELQN